MKNSYGRKLLKRFEEAARRHEMRGMYSDSPDYEFIIEEYEVTRAEMLRYLDRRKS
jgi:hypothetical protein